MIPILYESASGTVPTNYGLGALSDAITCEVTEERNGEYELTLVYPANGLHAGDIVARRVIKAVPNDYDSAQLFRIYKVTKTLGGTFTAYAQHISYDLNGYLASVGTASGAQNAVAYLSNGTPFNITTTKTSGKAFTVTTPASVRSYLAGREGSFLDTYGTAELHYDNYNIQIYVNRGSNRGAQIRYGKNLTELTEEIGVENLYTAVKPYWAKDGVVVEGGLKSTGLSLDVPRVFALDCSNDFQNAPTVAELNSKATAYVNAHVLATPDTNIKLDFVQLEEVKESIHLCDTVSIYYEAFGITASAKCIKTTWDVLRGRYTAIEFGTPKTSFAETIVQIEKTANEAVGEAVAQTSAAVTNATNLITGNSGGYVVLHKGADGKPYEILVMDTEDINTAQKVWRWNNAGWGYSSTGYYGTYTLAATQDGAIVADFITAGELDGAIIKADSIQSESISTSFLSDASATGGVIYQAFTAADGVLDSRIENKVSQTEYNEKVAELEGQIGNNYSELKQTAENIEITVGGVREIADGKADGTAFDSLKEKIDARFTFGTTGLEIRGIPNATAGIYTRIDSDSYDIMAEGQSDPIASFGAVATIPNLKIGKYLFKEKNDGAFQIVWES